MFASAASAYEVANKERLGKLPGTIAQDLPNVLRHARMPVQALTLEHTIAAGPHRDPWDQLIMAQALTDGFTVHHRRSGLPRLRRAGLVVSSRS